MKNVPIRPSKRNRDTMIRPIWQSLLTLVFLIGTSASLFAQESAQESPREQTEETISASSSTGSLEETYASWTASLEDDGTWELQMPPEAESEDLERLTTTLLEAPMGTDLNPGRKAGYLVALADRTALEGDRNRARSLYGVLGTSRVPLLQMWSVYMMAGLDFAEGQYGKAATGYERVCSESAPADWRDHACSMVGLAQRLDTLELEGGDHGDSVTATP
jgi:hypothetical protein